MKTLLLLLITIAGVLKLNAQCTPPVGSVACNPNIIYYGGGSCTFYDSLCTFLITVPANEAAWSCSPAQAKWVLVNPASGGYYEFPNYTSTAPEIDFRQYMKPFWNTDTIFNELILLTGPGSSASLMFQPQQILSVKNYNYQNSYSSPGDYTLNGRTLTQISAGMSADYSTTFGSGLENVQHTSWTNVTYIPDQSDWGGDSLTIYRGADLPNTMAKLNAQQDIIIQSIGMSITAGLNVSGFAGDPNNFTPTTPFMKSYIEMFAEQIRNTYGIGVTLYNSSCGGKTAEWGDEYCIPLVNLNQPDLVLIDFGMNDIWGNTTNAQFNAYIQSIMNKIRQGNPNVEFILIANMLPDVNGMGAPSNGDVLMKGFANELLGMETTGVVCFNMTTLSDSIYQRKGASHCTANALHPNDYLARWYAQGLYELIRFQPSVGFPGDIQSVSTQLTAHPNPSQGSVHIQWSGFSKSQPVQLRCIDLKGNILYNENHLGNETTLSLKQLNSAVVLIFVEQGKKRAVRRLSILN